MDVKEPNSFMDSYHNRNPGKGIGMAFETNFDIKAVQPNITDEDIFITFTRRKGSGMSTMSLAFCEQLINEMK